MLAVPPRACRPACTAGRPADACRSWTTLGFIATIGSPLTCRSGWMRIAGASAIAQCCPMGGQWRTSCASTHRCRTTRTLPMPPSAPVKSRRGDGGLSAFSRPAGWRARRRGDRTKVQLGGYWRWLAAADQQPGGDLPPGLLQHRAAGAGRERLAGTARYGTTGTTSQVAALAVWARVSPPQCRHIRYHA